MANVGQPHPIDAFLTERGIRKQAGTKAFEAGKRLYETGCVRSLGAYEDQVGAMVFTHEPNHARLLVQPGSLGLACTCRVGAAGRFCEHCVATALAWMNRRIEPSITDTNRDTRDGLVLMPGNGSRTAGVGNPAAANGNGRHAPANRPGEIALEDVTTMLMLLDKEMLVEMILSQATVDKKLLEGLIEAAAEAKATGAFDMEEYDLDTIRRDIEETIVPYELGGRSTTGAFAAEIVQIAQSLIEIVGTRTDQRKLLDVIELALERTAIAEENTRGDGLLPALIAMAGAWCNALAHIALDPEESAKRILAVVRRNESPALFRAIAHSLDLLADDTLDTLRAECLSALTTAPASPAVVIRYGRNYISATPLTIFILEFATSFGDADLVLALLTRNPTTGAEYCAIIDVLTDADRRNEALSWAERGLAALPIQDNAAVVEFLKDEYKRRGNHVRRAEMMLIDFERNGALSAFSHLRSAAKKAGTWATLRDRAYTFARKSATDRERDSTLVVEMLLHEGETEAAWNEAITGGCGHDTWMRLASARSATNPRDALAVYQTRIDELGGETSQGAYIEIVHILKLVAPVMEALAESFGEYLGELRTLHKRRRTFITMLDDAFPEQRAARG